MSAISPTQLPARLAPRLGQLILLLGSSHDGEQLAACAAIRRVLDGAGLSLHDLAAAIATARPPATARERQHDGVPNINAAECRTIARWCLEQAGDDDLSEREGAFVRQMASTRYAPTPKQAAWLVSIHDRLGGSAA
jgi:hypothetical protein